MANKTYLKAYLDALIENGKSEMASSIEGTAKDFAKENLYSFSFSDHEIGLLFGNVQAGKTTHKVRRTVNGRMGQGSPGVQEGAEQASLDGTSAQRMESRDRVPRTVTSSVPAPL